MSTTKAKIIRQEQELTAQHKYRKENDNDKLSIKN